MALRSFLLTLVVTASALPFGASAQIANPDNDWASYFRYNRVATQAAPMARGMPRLGDVSPDGQTVFLGDNRGWQPRPYSYEWQGTQLVHASDCPFVLAGGDAATNRVRRTS